jgi:pyruvate-formate lyase
MSSVKSGTDSQTLIPKYDIAKPHDLSPRNKWLRDYYFQGNSRSWNNEYMSFSTGLKGDRVWAETDYYIVPEVYFYMGTKSWGVYGSSVNLMAQNIKLPDGFWAKSLPERRIIFFREAMLNYIPHEIIGPELLAGGRFNTQLSKCLNEKEQKQFNKRNLINRDAVFEYHNYGFGNLGATGGHLIPDYETIIKKGFKFVYEQAKSTYESLSKSEQLGDKGAELRAMMLSCEIPRDLAAKYAQECRRLKDETKDFARREELEQMAKNLDRVPWEPATTFYEAIQSLWLMHMLVMSEESYPGPGVSFGRFDQYLWSLYEKDVLKEKKITKQFAKEILGSFWFHCNTVYDAQIKVGKQGITSGFGQLMTLSGLGKNGEDLTNELTYTLIEVIDEWSPILEPKPNIRLHRNSPDKLMDKIVDMVTRSQGAPFLLNFDERSIEGMILEGIPREDAWNYGCVGCLENTMQGNDRSGTVNCNTNLASSIGLTLWNGKSLYYKGLYSAGKKKMMHRGMVIKKPKQFGPLSGDPEQFITWDDFWNAWIQQMQYLIKYTVDTYNITEVFRADFMPTPYLSTMVRDCVKKGLDVRNGGPEIRFITIEGVGFATMVDSLLAIKKFVYDEKKYTIAEIKEALMANFEGKKEYTIMQALLKNKAPKFGNDEKDADELARQVMQVWSSETFKYKTPTDFKFRPGMLSWNYWAGEDASFTPATPNGRNANTFLSNAICPTNGADLNGPTANANSIGKAMGGKTDTGQYVNYLPNGASHTITFNPSLLKDKEAKDKFKAYLRGYMENGGSALQINILDPNMLKDAQINPQSYSNLLVRVTGYNAYFVAIGKELQDEIITRESHCF